MGAEICPVCSAGVAAAEAGLLKCTGCGLTFSPGAGFCAPEYAPGLADGIYGAAKDTLFSRALDLLDRELPLRGKLLDIGCAGGGLMKAAAARGWKVSGVELDASLAAAASGAGFEVHSRPVEEAGLPPGAYEAVTVFEVFCLMARPVAAAAEIGRLLKPGGMIYLREFNAGFHLPLRAMERRGFFGTSGLRPSVVHGFNFTAAALRLMLERAGFGNIRIRNSPPTSGDPYRTGGALGGFLTGAIKVLYYWLAQAVWLATFGRVLTGSSLIVTAVKK
jgi:SAM-dependent methyltransferase